MAIFSEIPQFLLTQYLNSINTLNDTIPVYALSLRTNCIITKGGTLLELFINDNENGFKKIYLKFNKTESDINSYMFFDKSNQLTFKDTFTETEPTGNDYYFKIYDDSLTEMVSIENGQQVYIRKDSLFHTWLKTLANTYYQNIWYEDFLTKNYINTNNFFIYFGQIYQDENNSYIINYEDMTEFVKKALPEHQRTDRLKEFFSLSFGKVFSEIYYKTKNITSLMDPMSIDDDFLNYILKFTNWDFIEKDTYSVAEREYIRDIIFLLKKKGTISSLYTLYKIFSNNSENRFNVYEKWHDNTWTTTVPSSGYYNYLYLHKYITSIDTQYLNTGAGAVYYSQFFPNFEWGGIDTKITIHSKSTSWNINHNLNTYNINFQVYNNDFTRLLPATATLTDLNNLVITFNTEETGYCFIKKADIRLELTSEYYNSIISAESGTIDGSSINHVYGYNASSINYDSDNVLIQPEIIKLSNGNIDTDRRDGYIVINEADEKVDSYATSTDWELTHTLNKKGLLVDCYNSDHERILPETVEIYDKNTINITLSKSISGYALLTDVGDPPDTITNVDDFDDLILSPHYIVEVDLTTEPLDGDQILTEETHDKLIKYWEKTRPINRVAHYQLILSPEVNFTGEYYDIYKSKESYVKSILEVSSIRFGTASDTYHISDMNNGTTWIIQHDLNTTDLLFSFFDNNSKRIYPNTIKTLNLNYIEVNFNTSVTGTSVIIKSDYNKKITINGEISHNLNDDVIQITKSDKFEIYYHNTVTLTDDNTLTIDNVHRNDVINIKSNTETYNFTSNSSWFINHNTGYQYFISAYYDSNDVQIYPQTETIINANNILAEFSEPIEGYAVIFFIQDGSDMFSRITEIEDGVFTVPSMAISDTQDHMVTYDYKGLIKDANEDANYVYLTFEIPEEDKYTIREIGVIDDNDVVIFTTKCSDIIKKEGVKMIIFYKISKEI